MIYPLISIAAALAVPSSAEDFFYSENFSEVTSLNQSGEPWTVRGPVEVVAIDHPVWSHAVNLAPSDPPAELELEVVEPESPPPAVYFDFFLLLGIEIEPTQPPVVTVGDLQISFEYGLEGDFIELQRLGGQPTPSLRLSLNTEATLSQWLRVTIKVEPVWTTLYLNDEFVHRLPGHVESKLGFRLEGSTISDLLITDFYLGSRSPLPDTQGELSGEETVIADAGGEGDHLLTDSSSTVDDFPEWSSVFRAALASSSASPVSPATDSASVGLTVFTPLE